MNPTEEMELKQGKVNAQAKLYGLLHCAYCHAKFGARKYRMSLDFMEHYGTGPNWNQLMQGYYCKPECLRKAIDLVVIE